MAEENQFSEAFENVTKTAGEIGQAHNDILGKAVNALVALSGNILNGFTGFIQSFTNMVSKTLDNVTSQQS